MSEQYKACFVHNNKTHNQQKERKNMRKDCKSMTLKCKVKTKIIMKMNYKLLTKITKHNLERKNLKKKQAMNKTSPNAKHRSKVKPNKNAS